VVVFRHDGQHLMKRVLAVEGDTVYLFRQKGSQTSDLVMRSQLAHFRRMADSPHWGSAMALEELTVPPGTCFVLGDHTFRSVDSRDFGPVPVESITGKVLFAPPAGLELRHIAHTPGDEGRS
jgi:signal peptidase I